MDAFGGGSHGGGDDDPATQWNDDPVAVDEDVLWDLQARPVPYDAPRLRNPVAQLIQSQATDDMRSAAEAAGGEALSLFERWLADCNSVSDYAHEQQYDREPSDHSSDMSMEELDQHYVQHNGRVPGDTSDGGVRDEDEVSQEAPTVEPQDGGDCDDDEESQEARTVEEARRVWFQEMLWEEYTHVPYMGIFFKKA